MGIDDDFPDEQTAAFALFEDVTTRLVAQKVKFVVVGGWVSWFFHQSTFCHPGTFDVDVLLQSESLEDGTFSSATERMLNEADYIRSVKNRFQVHRVLRVNGERMIFHADFLNEEGSDGELDLVVVTAGCNRSLRPR